MGRFLIKSAQCSILMVMLSMVMGVIFEDSGSVIFYFLLFASYLITTMILGQIIINAKISGWKLFMALTLVYWGIGQFNALIEAVIFNVMEAQEAINNLIYSLFMAFVLSIVSVYFFKGMATTYKADKVIRRSIGSWIWRILVGDFLYLVVYITAGTLLMAAYPDFLGYYEGKMPSPTLIIKTQLFLRGFVFIGLGVLVIYIVNGSRLKKSLLVGSVFMVFGAIAPLIVPNEFMPFNVRMAHLVETGSSNFLYGFLVGQLFSLKAVSKFRNAGLAQETA